MPPNISNEELADMHMVYGEARGNAREAVRLYQERFPNRYLPGHRMFTAIHRRLRENGRFDVVRGPYDRARLRLDDIEENVLQYFHARPRASTRAAARDLGIRSHVNVWRVLQRNNLYPYHFQTVQDLLPNDYNSRANFAHWCLLQIERDEQFLQRVLFTDEATFTRAGLFNTHNMHSWEEENPHEVHRFRFQHRFSVNVWAGIVGDCLIGPYLMPSPLNGQRYGTFLRETLPLLLQDVPLDVRRRMWFQHDGAPAHSSRIARQYLNERFGDRWIGRNGPVPWPPRSPDLTPLDFYLWGHMKSLVYETPVESEMDLVARVAVAAGDIAQDRRMLSRWQGSLHRRCQTCIEVGGRHFEQFL